ncbi:MAG: hypothetical protein N0E55_00170 [Candidatus Thiodiazotropha taylori]|nr:hypothetical protein [Candidatus Thiodiazotropha taylori]MCG8108183.1 hypothetical protein [Candidatus Thiodiazotropha taylori]MCG8112493.1 hypothetical protein [Candidatus Thiodiazotropha taylori]MCG8122365.1 hypothetical protein [Candidatus Thiodiazotropha taylori]MCW4251095.1 hypothetical protein [Candidatus Thiodiazotropha taylori]
MNVKINFPILLVRETDGYMTVTSSETEYGICSGVAIKKGYFNNILIIDAYGYSFYVEGVNSKRPFNKSWKWIVELLQYNSILYKVDLSVQATGKLQLSNIKDLVLKNMKKNSMDWDSGVGVDELEIEISNAKTPKEIIELLE